MKATIITVLAIPFFLLNGWMYGSGKGGDRFCATKENGKLIVSYNGKAIKKETKVESGTVVKPDGNVTFKDGSKLTLKEGQCIDRDGSMSSTATDESEIPTHTKK